MFERLMRRGCGMLALVALLGVGCDDPLASLEKARGAIEDGKKAAIAQARADAMASAGKANDFADDEEARRKAGGISLGPDHAKRLYYQFIDGRGRVAFVERLDDVPAQWRDRVGFVEMESPPPLSPAMAEQTRDRRYAASAGSVRQPGAGVQRVAARAATPIVLYSADWCGWCKKAQRHLDAAGVDYEVRDIDISENLDELVAKTGQKGIPVLDVGGKVVTGFSPGQYDQLIRDART